MNKKLLILAATSFLTLGLVACDNKPAADLVVFADSIYTANANGDFVTAFAVKDGKYIAVGDNESIRNYIGNSTKVISNKFAMPGAIESHGHWILEEAFKLGCFVHAFNEDGSPASYEQVINEIKAYQTAHPELTEIYGYGINVIQQGMPTITQLDEAFPDIPVFISEGSLHGAWANSKCLKEAGIYDADVEGVHIERDDKGLPTGVIKDEACGYVRNHIFGALLSENDYKQAIVNAAKHLSSMGYTSHYDMWSNFDGTTEMYKAMHSLEEDGDLNFLFSGAYAIESYEKSEASSMIQTAVDLKNQYSSQHFKPNYLKLFADGVMESCTGYITSTYKDKPNNHGTRIWDPETMNNIVNEANSNGLLVHIHTMGDAAVTEAVDSFIYSESNNGYYRNSLGHVALINENDLSRVKDHNIAVSSGANWASQTTEDDLALVDEYVMSKEMYCSLYPFKDYVDYGIKAALHTDNPCLPGILDLFGYIQVMVNGMDHNLPITEKTIVRRNDFVSVKDAIDMYTINGAWMNNLENERGSIEVGKYADFIFTNSDPFKVNIDDVYKVSVTNTYFEGNKVFPLAD